MSITVKIGEPRHPDFEKIYQQFIKRYGKEKGEDYYYAWLNKLKLDDTKPYGPQAMKESFKWAESTIKWLRENDRVKTYEVEALFPLSSMNDVIYTEEEIKSTIKRLEGRTPNLNHTDSLMKGVLAEDADYEDGVAGIILTVDKNAKCSRGYKYVDMFDCSPSIPEDYHIYHVSIEGRCKGGIEETPEGSICNRLFLDDFACLTKKVLPGIPLTRITPVERLVESSTITRIIEEFNNKKIIVPLEGGIINMTNKQEGKEKDKPMIEKLAERDLEISELKMTIRKLETEKAAAIATSDSKDPQINELLARVKDLEKEFSVAKGQHETSQRTLSETIDSLSDKSAVLSRTEEVLRTVKAELVEEKKQHEVTNANLKVETDAHYDLATKNNVLQRDLRDKNNRIMYLEDEINKERQKSSDANRDSRKKIEELENKLNEINHYSKIILKIT